jgi:hypothetical protein
MSGSCVDEEAIVLGGSGSRSGNALIVRSKRFSQSCSEVTWSFFAAFSMFRFPALHCQQTLVGHEINSMSGQLTPIRF